MWWCDPYSHISYLWHCSPSCHCRGSVKGRLWFLWNIFSSMRAYVAFPGKTGDTPIVQILFSAFCLYCSCQTPGDKAKSVKKKKCLFLPSPPCLVSLSVMTAELLTVSDLITDKCRYVHYHLPYRWQVYNGVTWKDLAMMEKVEKAYCDPQTTRYSDAALLA